MAENVMRKVRIGKVTLNIGMGEAGDALKRAELVMKQLVTVVPVQTICKSKIPTWGIREGLHIGVKATLRDQNARIFLERALVAKDKQLNAKNFDKQGNFSFGIKEYIDLPGVKYDPKLGILGLDVCVTLERPGYRVKRRKLKSRLGKNHEVSKEDAIDFIKKEFGVEIN